MRALWQKLFLFSLWGFLLGVAVESLFGFWLKWGIFFLASGLFLLALFVIFSFLKMVLSDDWRFGNWFFSKRKFFLISCFCCWSFCLGLWRTSDVIVKIGSFEERDFSGVVRLVKEPRSKQDYQVLTVEVVGIEEGGEFKNQKLLVFADNDRNFEYGEVLKIRCRLMNPENEYEKFNYQKFLAKDGIFQLCKRSRIEKLEVENLSRSKQEQFLKSSEIGDFLLKKVFGFRRILEDKIKIIFSQPEQGYLAGLLLGGDDRLSEEAAESFRRTGTTHTVAVSGYNITIIAELVMFLAIIIGFWRRQAFYIAVLSITFFVLMIGAPASAIRAAIMGVLILWAANLGRLADSTRMILLAAAVMMLISPLSLLYDAGFQLSFLATLGIVLIYGSLSDRFRIKNDFLEIKSIILTTISAQVAVTGLIIYSFQTFSPISLLANLLILPAIPFIMLGGFLTVIVGFISLSLAKFLALPVWLALSLEIKVVEFLAGFSWANVEIEGIGIGWLVLYYVVLILVVGYLRRTDT